MHFGITRSNRSAPVECRPIACQNYIVYSVRTSATSLLQTIDLSLSIADKSHTVVRVDSFAILLRLNRFWTQLTSSGLPATTLSLWLSHTCTWFQCQSWHKLHICSLLLLWKCCIRCFRKTRTCSAKEAPDLLLSKRETYARTCATLQALQTMLCKDQSLSQSPANKSSIIKKSDWGIIRTQDSSDRSMIHIEVLQSQIKYRSDCYLVEKAIVRIELLHCLQRLNTTLTLLYSGQSDCT